MLLRSQKAATLLRSNECGPRDARTSGGLVHGGISSMNVSDTTPRRIRVEANIYRRPDGKYEVGWRDVGGMQRWRTVSGGLAAARALREEVLARRAEGAPEERVAPVRFGTAARKWLEGPVTGLRPATQASYANSIDRHLLPRFAHRRLDAISADDVAKLIRELRDEGLAEASISSIVAAFRRTYRYAARRLGGSGQDPAGLLMRAERPRLSTARRRPISKAISSLRRSPLHRHPFSPCSSWRP